MDLRNLGFFNIAPSELQERRHGPIRLVLASGLPVFCDTVDEAVALLRELAKKTTSRKQVLDGFKSCGLIK